MIKIKTNLMSFTTGSFIPLVIMLGCLWFAGAGCKSLFDPKVDTDQVLKNITKSASADAKVTYFCDPETRETMILIENVEIDDFSMIIDLSPDILALENCTIKDLDRFYKLPVKNLQLDTCQVPLLEKEIEKKSLETVYFKNTPLGDYSFLKGQPMFIFTVIGDNKLKELNSLPILNGGAIVIYNCKNIQDFTALKNQLFINFLAIKNCPLKDISFVLSLKNLTVLDIAGSEVNDISALKDSKIKVYTEPLKI